MDGRRGAKSRVDREGGWGQGAEMDGGSQGEGRVAASAGQTPSLRIMDRAQRSRRGHSDSGRRRAAGGLCMLPPPTAAQGGSSPFSVGGN